MIDRVDEEWALPLIPSSYRISTRKITTRVSNQRRAALTKWRNQLRQRQCGRNKVETAAWVLKKLLRPSPNKENGLQYSRWIIEVYEMGLNNNWTDCIWPHAHLVSVKTCYEAKVNKELIMTQIIFVSRFDTFWAFSFTHLEPKRVLNLFYLPNLNKTLKGSVHNLKGGALWGFSVWKNISLWVPPQA